MNRVNLELVLKRCWWRVRDSNFIERASAASLVVLVILLALVLRFCA